MEPEASSSGSAGPARTGGARPATSGDVDALAGVLARAFYDDPVTSFLFPNEKRRPRALQKFFSIEVGRLYLPYGGVWTSPSLDGAAVWAPPGHKRSVFADMVKVLPVAPYVASHPIRATRVLTALEAKHPTDHHFYLATLGTDPPSQGRGVGSSLLAPTLARCDEEGVPAYLESSKEANVPFYRRHGFEVIEEFPLPSGGPSVWLMRREPR